MPANSKSKQQRQKAASNGHRTQQLSKITTSQSTTNCNSIEEEEVDDEPGDYFVNRYDIDPQDLQCLDDAPEQNSVVNANNILQWVAQSCNKLYSRRSPNYTFNAERTNQRQRAKKRKLDEASESCNPLTSYFRITNPKSNEPDDSAKETKNKLSLDVAINLIDELPFMANNCKQTKNADFNSLNFQFEIKRATSVRVFLLKLKSFCESSAEKQDLFSKMETSCEIAEIVYKTEEFQNLEYRARCIRYWANFFLENGKFPIRRHGKNQKLLPRILDEDISSSCLAYLRSLKRKELGLLTQKSFSQWIENNIEGCHISPQAAGRWLHHLGFHHAIVRKGIYVDGHERADVVQYRKKFVLKMHELQKRMRRFTGVEMENETPPTLQEDETEIVLVVHDESTFSSNDGRTYVWMEDGKPPLRPKGDGKCIMISEFLCPCHGRLRHSNGSMATESINPGTNSDGWWDNADLCKQLTEKAIPIFNQLHPGKTALFAFDNSGNHGAMAPDALIANRLKLGDGFPKRTQKGVDKTRTIPFRNGWYLDQQGNRNVQAMANASGIQKGVKSILTERGLFTQNHKINLKEATLLLAEQPDFKEQKGWLEELVEMNNHMIVFFPKFHPEFNFIEMYWGIAKQFTRSQCDYSWEALQSSVPLAFDSIKLSTIRRQADHCFRYMDAYRRGDLAPFQVEWAMKKYSSHRRIKDHPIATGQMQFLSDDFFKCFTDMPIDTDNTSK